MPIPAKARSDNIVESILEGWRRGTRGPLPQITPLQLLNALVLIEREGPVGRRALAHALQINDGIARGLMERLGESKIVSVTETGVQLSKPGRQSLHRFLRQLSVKKILPLQESDLIPDRSTVAVHLTGSYKPRMTGISQRDEAIKAGAEGSITIAAVSGRLVLPPDNKSLANVAPKENARLRAEFEPSNGDLIIIGFGKDESLAQAGALAAVLSLNR
ncbi:DUF4443 domain-containing protein [Candidatus Bathyarchaeota archaeon]|nr:DUF4443 domain-containing protein [Candidatus Bathyarchaeota archaeon]